MFPHIKDYYQRGLITKDIVEYYHSAGLITEEEYLEIINEESV